MSGQSSGRPAAGEPKDTAKAGAKDTATGDTEPPKIPAYMTRQAGGGEPGGGERTPARTHGPSSWSVPEPSPSVWLEAAGPEEPAPVRAATVWSALATGLLAALLLGDGLGLNVLLVAVPAALGAYAAARAAGRRMRPWTLVWAVGGLVLLLVPALRDAGWPTFLALVAALGLGSLALHGTRTWRGTLLGCAGVFCGAVPGIAWAWHGLRERAEGSRDRWGPVVRTGGTAVGLLVVFGALFAGADAAFADLLARMVPEMSLGDGPVRLPLLVLGVVGALAAAHTAAAPWRWDRIESTPGQPRGRVEWALPLIALNVLFAVFIVIQLTVLFGGYDKVLDETGLSYAQYARQGFWQLLAATLLTLVVIALALRWAPRGAVRDRTLVRAVLGTLCVLTLVVVASALRRMEWYVDAYGLTRLRVSAAGIELWLGVVILLIMAAGLFGGRWLPRAVVASAGAAVLCFGLASPDALVAEQNVKRFERTGTIDLEYLQDLSADAVPALDALPEPQRSCALWYIADDLRGAGDPWYATSRGEARARSLLAERPVDRIALPCGRLDGEGRARDAY